MREKQKQNPEAQFTGWVLLSLSPRGRNLLSSGALDSVPLQLLGIINWVILWPVSK